MALESNHLRKEPGSGRLDRIDRGLVAALQEDVRRSNKELAVRVGLSESACLERVRRLRAAGVVRGAWAEIDPRALGIELEAMVAVQLRQHARGEVDAFRAHVVALPEVVAVHHVAGRADFLVQVVARGTAHLRDLVLDAFSARPEVGRVETSIIFQSTWSPRLPDLLDAAPAPPRARRSARARARRPG